jgi:hypothetical protein
MMFLGFILGITICYAMLAFFTRKLAKKNLSLPESMSENYIINEMLKAYASFAPNHAHYSAMEKAYNALKTIGTIKN